MSAAPLSSWSRKPAVQEQIISKLHPAKDHSLDNLAAGLLAGVAPKKKTGHDEGLMQRAVIKWWSVQCRFFGVPEILLFSIPNGGGRSGPIVGSILKAEGLRKGAPDLFLAVPRFRFEPTPNPVPYGHTGWPLVRNDHGLFLELKTRTGVVSPYQQDFHEELRKQGYRVEVVRSSMEAINAITSYLNNAAHDAAKE